MPRRESVPAAIASVIREKIFRGELTPGARLIENALSKELRAGQPTVREALFTLEREGLVERVPNLGTFVRELDIKDISNLYRVRAELEGLAGELAAQRATREEIERLRDMAMEMKSGARGGGKWGFLQADLAFHRFLWKLSGNPQLAALLEPVVVPLLAFSYMQIDRTTEELFQSADVHISIADALVRGPREARAAIETNMRVFLDRYFSYVLNAVLPAKRH